MQDIYEKEIIKQLCIGLQWLMRIRTLKFKIMTHVVKLFFLLFICEISLEKDIFLAENDNQNTNLNVRFSTIPNVNHNLQKREVYASWNVQAKLFLEYENQNFLFHFSLCTTLSFLSNQITSHQGIHLGNK